MRASNRKYRKRNFERKRVPRKFSNFPLAIKDKRVPADFEGGWRNTRLFDLSVVARNSRAYVCRNERGIHGTSGRTTLLHYQTPQRGISQNKSGARIPPSPSLEYARSKVQKFQKRERRNCSRQYFLQKYRNSATTIVETCTLPIRVLFYTISEQFLFFFFFFCDLSQFWYYYIFNIANNCDLNPQIRCTVIRTIYFRS